MLLTSGTDKNLKVIPFTKIALQETIRYSNIAFGTVGKNIDKSWMDGHLFSPTEAGYSKLPSGIILGTASSVVTKSLERITRGKYTFRATPLMLRACPGVVHLLFNFDNSYCEI